MDLVRRREHRPAATFRSAMDDLFSRFFEDWDMPPATQWTPALDLTDREDRIVVTAEVPGMDPEDIDIQIDGRNLVISGEKRQEHEENEGEWRRTERRYGSFRRVVPLPSEVDVDSVEATGRNGVLTITLPKSESERPRRIEVKS